MFTIEGLIYVFRKNKYWIFESNEGRNRDRPLGPLIEGNVNIDSRWTAIDDPMRSSFAYYNNRIVVIAKDRYYHFGTDGTLFLDGIIYNWFEALNQSEVNLLEFVCSEEPSSNCLSYILRIQHKILYQKA